MSFVQSRENRFYTGIAPGTRSFAYLHCRSDQDAPVNICQRPYVSNSFWCATDICALEPRATRTHGDRRYSFEIGSWPNSSPGKSMFHQYNPIYIYIYAHLVWGCIVDMFDTNTRFGWKFLNRRVTWDLQRTSAFSSGFVNYCIGRRAGCKKSPNGRCGWDQRWVPIFSLEFGEMKSLHCWFPQGSNSLHWFVVHI